MTISSKASTHKASATIGVLALQGGFHEHLDLVKSASSHFQNATITTVEVRTPEQLKSCDALIIPGGESTTISFVAAQSGLLEPLRDFVKVQKRPTWGTCAGLILLSEEANATKKGGQELIGGLPVRVHRNHFGRQIESFQSSLSLPFLTLTSSTPPSQLSPSTPEKPLDTSPFPGVFIRAPVVEQLLDEEHVEVLARLPGRVAKVKPAEESQAETRGEDGDITAVRRGNVLGMSFHPELTKDERIHVWWLGQVLEGMS